MLRQTRASYFYCNGTFRILFFVLVCNCAFGQEKKPSDIVDSLSHLDYSTIKSNISKNDSIAPILYAKAYLKKAKREKDTLRIAKAFNYFLLKSDTIYSYNYADSIIDLTKNKSYKDYPLNGYFFKGLDLYAKRRFNEALDNFLKAKKLAKSDDPDIEYNIGLIKSRLGYNEEAISAFKFSSKHYAKSNYMAALLGTYYAIGDSYRFLGKIDSSLHYNRLGHRLSLENDDNVNLNYFLLNIGATLSDKKELQASQEKLMKVLPNIIELGDKPNIAMCHFFLGRNYKDLNKEEKSLYHFKQMDSVFLEINDLHPELRQGYEVLINHYKGNKDLESQLTYVNRVLSLDSILHKNYRYLDKKLSKEYTDAKLLIERKKISEKIISIKNNYLYKLVLAGGILLVLIGLLIYKSFRHRQDKRGKERFEALIDEIKNSKTTLYEKDKPVINSDLKEDIVNDVISKMKAFEDSKAFINSDLTRSRMAKDFNTNVKYLSIVINQCTGKNFSNYISDLRIDYAIDKIKNDKKFRSYTVKIIAEEVGFNSYDPFSRAFHKKTGIKPSFFIKEIQNSNLDS